MVIRVFPTLISVFFLGLSITANAFTPSTIEVDGRHVPELERDTTLKTFQFDQDKFIGHRFTGFCPPAGPGDKPESVDGNTVFDSVYPICLAAEQTGAIDSEGGLVTVQLNPEAAAYGGSAGTTARRTLSVIGKSDPAAVDRIYRDHVQRIDWYTKFTRTGFAYKHLVGQRFTFQCPAAPSNMRPRRVVGTDTYAYDSVICLAGVHAGAVTMDGGLVTVQMNPGSIQLSASVRNGVETSSGTSGVSALTFVDNPVGP